MNFKNIKKIFYLASLSSLPMVAFSCSNQSSNSSSSSEESKVNFNEAKNSKDVKEIAKLFNINLNSVEKQLDWNEFKEEYMKVQFDEQKSSEFLSSNWVTFIANLTNFYAKSYPKTSENNGWFLFPDTEKGKHTKLYIHVLGIVPQETFSKTHSHIQIPNKDIKLNSSLTNFSSSAMINEENNDEKVIFLTKKRTVIKITESQGKIKILSPSYTFLPQDINSSFVRSVSIGNEYIEFLFNKNRQNRTQTDFEKFENMTFDVGVPYKSFLILK
ncbi:hypothetical protein [Mycoplasma sp. OR1901]|uniref:hypothetical protein n=1 Tax=Mycoplasma sp. OR1901 TaxID=2742195 RepID=UPI0015839471|nr:hypothetical protein [Mycoplasma sp. OR1901]QKT05268.1 hypothetical protein HTZ87_00940 [Mycoplasma sp. OR1901]